jgi:hypothetical protein
MLFFSIIVRTKPKTTGTRGNTSKSRSAGRSKRGIQSKPNIVAPTKSKLPVPHNPPGQNCRKPTTVGPDFGEWFREVVEAINVGLDETVHPPMVGLYDSTYDAQQRVFVKWWSRRFEQNLDKCGFANNDKDTQKYIASLGELSLEAAFRFAEAMHSWRECIQVVQNRSVTKQ